MHPPRAAGPRVDGVVVVVACVGQKKQKEKPHPRWDLNPRPVSSARSRSGLKVQRSNQLSYLCLKDRAVDRYFCRVTDGVRGAVCVEPARSDVPYVLDEKVVRGCGPASIVGCTSKS